MNGTARLYDSEEQMNSAIECAFELNKWLSNSKWFKNAYHATFVPKHKFNSQERTDKQMLKEAPIHCFSGYIENSVASTRKKIIGIAQLHTYLFEVISDTLLKYNIKDIQIGDARYVYNTINKKWITIQGPTH